MDVGIEPLAVVQRDGDQDLVVENPKAYYALERKLRRWQRAQARRTKRSRGWQEAQRRIGKIQRRIRGIRDNVQHQLSAHLVKTYSHIRIESLRVKGLFQNGHLAKALTDSAMSKFLGRIEYKSRWYGRELITANQWYPSSKTCLECGAVNGGLRQEKSWKCHGCGVAHDRDVNAARNLHECALPAGRRDVTLLDEKALAVASGHGETGPEEGRTQPVPAVAGI